MSKTSEAETLKNQIKYLTDLINNAKKRKQVVPIKKTPPNASIEVRGHQQRAGPHHHVNHTKTDLHKSTTGHGQQPQSQQFTSEKQKNAQKSLKQGKYVWTKNSDQSQVVPPGQSTTSAQSYKKVQAIVTPGLKKNVCSTEVGSPSKLSSRTLSLESVRGNVPNVLTLKSSKALADISTVSGTLDSSKGSCVNVKNTVSAKRTDGTSLHSQAVKSTTVPTAASKQVSCIQNVSSNIVHVPASQSSSPSTDDVSSAGLKSIRTQLVHKLKGTGSLSIKSVSSLQLNSSTSSPTASNIEGKSSLRSSKDTKCTSTIPSLIKPQLSIQKSVPPTPSSVASTKKSSGDTDVILLAVHSQSPEPLERNIKRELPQTQEKLSVIPSFLKNHLRKKLSKEVDSLLTLTNTVPKVEPEIKVTQSAPSMPSSESQHLQSSRVPSSGIFIAHSGKETILPQRKPLSAKSSSMLSKECISPDTVSPALSIVETTSLCQGSEELSTTNPSHSTGNGGPSLSPSSDSSQLLDAGAVNHPASPTKPSMSVESTKMQSSSLVQLRQSKELSSPVSKTFKSTQSTAASPSKLSTTKCDESKTNISITSSTGSNSSISLLPDPFKGGTKPVSSLHPLNKKAHASSLKPVSLLSCSSVSCTNEGSNVIASGFETKLPKTDQVSVSSPTSSPQKSSQPSQINSTSSPSKTGIVEKMDSRKDTVLQLSEKLAKTQAEIKRMTRNITNGQVTMKSIAAIKKEKSVATSQSRQTKAKLLQGMKAHKAYKMYGQDSSKGSKFPFKKGHTFPYGLNSSKFHSRFKRSSSSNVVFDKKYSLDKKAANPGSSTSQTLRSVVTPSKTQVVAKVIKSKYKLWKVTSGVKSPPVRYNSVPPTFPSKTFPASRGNSFPSNYSYHGQRGRGRGWVNPYGHSSYPYQGMRKHHTYPGTRDIHGQYTGNQYPVHKGVYPVASRGSYQPFTPQRVKRSHRLRSKVIFDKKYVLKRLQHNYKSSPSSFKLDKRRQLMSVPSGATGVSTPRISTLRPTGTPGKSSFVVINGMLYRSSSKSLVRTSPVKMSPVKSSSSIVDSPRNPSIVVKKMQSKSMKLVTVRGVQFQMDAGGKTLKRVNSTSSIRGDAQQSQTTVKRLDIGGVTFVRNSQGALERVGSANTRVVANRVIHKSIAAATARYRKSNTQNKHSKQYCLFFNRFGKCKRGDKCPYIHDPDKVAVCTRFLRGTCQMTGCPFSHKVVKEKMPVCSYFLRGVCNRDNCPYLHVKVNKNASVCQNFVKGFCPLGEKCKKQHTLECPVFGRTGQCPAGRTCPLIHKTRKDKPRRKRSMNTTVGESPKELDQVMLKRTATDSGITEDKDNTSGVPFKLQKLPTFISLGSGTGTETQTLTPAVQAIRIKPKL